MILASVAYWVAIGLPLLIPLAVWIFVWGEEQSPRDWRRWVKWFRASILVNALTLSVLIAGGAGLVRWAHEFVPAQLDLRWQTTDERLRYTQDNLDRLNSEIRRVLRRWQRADK